MTEIVAPVAQVPADPLAGKNHRTLRIAIRAAFTGIKTGTLTNIPDCPPEWSDVEEVWDGAAMFANVAKIMIYGIIMFNVVNGTIPKEVLSLVAVV